MGKAADQRLAEARLELLKAAAIHQPHDDLADVVGRAQVGGHYAQHLGGVVSRFLRAGPVHRLGLALVKLPNRAARQCQRMGVVLGQIIRHARQARVHVATAEVFGRDDLARRGLHQRRAGEEDRALFLHDDGHVRHRGHVSTARGAGAHDHGDLGDALGAHPRLIVEDCAEMVAVGENLVLVGQVRTAGVHQIDAGQMVRLGNLLRAEVFLHRHRVVGAALHGGVVADHHDLMALHPTNARDHPRTGCRAAIKPMRCCGADLQKRAAGVEKVRHPLAGQHLAAAFMPGAGFFAAA